MYGIIQAFFWVIKHNRQIRMARYLFISIIVASVLLVGALFSAKYCFDPVVNWIVSLVGFDMGQYAWVQWSITIGQWILKLIIFFVFFRHVLAIVYSPILAYLTDNVIVVATGDPAFQPNFWSSIKRSIVVNFRMLSRELIFLSPWLFLSLIPVINIPSGIILFLTTSYYSGLGTLDYTLEKYYDVAQTEQFARKNKWEVTCLGLLQNGFALIPFIGIILGPPICAAVGAYWYSKHLK